MASFPNNLHNAFPDNIIDVDDLSLSNHGGLDNVFDLNLHDSGHSFFADSKGQSELECIFSDTKMEVGPEELDRMFLEESIRSSSDVFMDTQSLECVGVNFDSVQADTQPSSNKTNGLNRNGSRRRNSQPESMKHSVKKMKAFKLDPAPYNPKNNPKRRSINRRSNNRRSSCNDLADFEDCPSFIYTPNSDTIYEHQTQEPRRRATVDSTHAPSLAELLGHQGNGAQECAAESSFQYHESLQKLAASMRRSELSRRQVMMQRNALLGAAGQMQQTAPVAQHANSHLAQQQVAHQQQQIAHQQQQQIANNSAQQQFQQCVMGGYTNSPTPFSATSPPQCVSPIMNNDRPHNIAAFLSGSRGTLTNGLEQSRRDLGMYVNRVSRRGSGFM